MCGRCEEARVATDCSHLTRRRHGKRMEEKLKEDGVFSVPVCAATEWLDDVGIRSREWSGLEMVAKEESALGLPFSSICVGDAPVTGESRHEEDVAFLPNAVWRSEARHAQGSEMRICVDAPRDHVENESSTPQNFERWSTPRLFALVDFGAVLGVSPRAVI